MNPWLSVINIIDGIKEPTCGHQNCNTSLILVSGGYVNVSKYFVYMSYYLGQYHFEPYCYLGNFAFCICISISVYSVFHILPTNEIGNLHIIETLTTFLGKKLHQIGTRYSTVQIQIVSGAKYHIQCSEPRMVVMFCAHTWILS